MFGRIKSFFGNLIFGNHKENQDEKENSVEVEIDDVLKVYDANKNRMVEVDNIIEIVDCGEEKMADDKSGKNKEVKEDKSKNKDKTKGKSGKKRKHKKDEYVAEGMLPTFEESTKISQDCFDNRELSWLKFNDRVLEEAFDRKNPLMERLTFIDIFRTNLDEFYRVRVGTLIDRTKVPKEKNKKDNKTGLIPKEQLARIFERTEELLQKRDNIYKKLMEEVVDFGLSVRDMDMISIESEIYLKRIFDAKIRPILSPQIVGKKQPFPFLKHGETYVVAILEGKGKNNGEKLCIIPCNSGHYERLISITSQEKKYVLSEDVILRFVAEIFDRYTVKSKAIIRLVRNADIDVDEEFSDEDMDHRDSMEKLIKMRRRLGPVMLQYRKNSDNRVIKTLCKELELELNQSFKISTPLDTSYVFALQDEMRYNKDLFFERRVPQISKNLVSKVPIMDQVKEKDILLSYPFESMTSFITMLKEAGENPNVLSIKMTLYRVAKNSQVVEALIDAAENGKEVVVLVELRARFDEENNIEWSRRMEDAGCRIIYGIDYTKVHSKICLITYVEDGVVKHISQVGTGNYNEKTSKLYTDISILTANEDISKEVEETFNKVSEEQVMEETKHLLVAPKCLQNKVLDMIDEEIKIAKDGGCAYLGFKFNSLTDKAIIDKLIEASMAGVRIDMTVRGICCLVPGVKGFTENINIQSIVGRYLEHSRIYIFGTKGRDKIYISSADFMTRNTLRRVEVACPIYDEDIKERIRNMFKIIMMDNVKARVLNNKAEYHKKSIKKLTDEEIINSQEYFFKESYGEL